MTDTRYQKLRDEDHRYLWHPFTQMRTWLADDEPLIVERGEGNWLIDVNGRRYLDGVSSLWCNVHGHRNPVLDAALHAQIEKIAHSTMLGMANAPAIELARELIAIAPAGLSRVFYSDSGAEAVEVAIRIAAQYWQLRNEPRRTRFVTLTESYHGDTIGSVSLGYSEMFHRHLKPMLFPVLKTDPPHMFRFYRRMSPVAAERTAIAAAREMIQANRDELAALVIEPLMQGAAGMWNHSPEFLRAICELAREAGALVIFDEVAVGFGRTGTMFACEQAGIAPDLMCLGKGLTGGYLPLAATLATAPIFEAFLGEPDEYRAFYYGHTYTGNPLAAAVAIANLGLYREHRVIERIQAAIAQMRDGLARRFEKHPQVADLRQCGLMAGIEVMADPASRTPYPSKRLTGARIARAARKHGVAIRPLGDVIVLMPPLSITSEELDLLLDAARAALDEAIA
ncbi:MAG: adenosylmethionine--8-amino-7-oxononanoate transaminase [Candidatus Binataceae bacterium]|nr:adenosylmethionine--8-amino-7-oxononanoate transaminase [Candidatus Binataceae bacterium]